ncbi:hypothetical protein ZTR_03135 [Talaromyces verruculosus]|nr:hypothetical protein ZTR_03135 [Talaromyces verruculosus]
MSTLFPDMRDEVDAKLLVELDTVLVYPKVVRMVSRVNAKIFVGNGLHEKEEWITINSNYTKNIFISSAKLIFFHPVLRPFVQYFIPELRTVWHCNCRARELVAPIIAQRKLLEKDTDFKKPNDSIQWLRDLVPAPDQDDAHFHGILQLGIGAVSMNMTSQLISNAIFNLATWPEYMPVLREEMEDVLSQAGGTWTMNSMGQLKKLDSFMKETSRHSGHLTVTFQRLARQPVTLSDGTQIPVGTMAFTPANAVNFDQEIYPDTNTFDGWRFYNLQQVSPQNEKKYQFVSTTKEQLQFGLGRHSCPGRWFAGHEIKLILAGLIDKFEFRLKHGEGRPKTMLFQTNQLPDPKAEILFKNRK